MNSQPPPPRHRLGPFVCMGIVLFLGLVVLTLVLLLPFL